MKKMKLAILLLAGISFVSASSFALDFAETYDTSELVDAVSEASAAEAAALLAAELLAIDRMDIPAEEKEAWMRAAIVAVFDLFPEERNELAEALGNALGHGSMQLLSQVESLLNAGGYNAATFSAAAIAASTGGESVPPPVSLTEPAPAPAPIIPSPPPVAPPYAGQSLP